MAIPDFQSIMLPLLEFAGDGQEHTNQDAFDTLTRRFNLTEDEQKALLPSGQQSIINNRIAWTRAHLKMARLIENTKRGVFRITERGRKALDANPTEINIKFLRQFAEYKAARTHHREEPVSRPEIQKFAGALQGKRARKGIFITTSRFCETAKDFASNLENKIILIDGEQLAQYMIDFGVGVAAEAAYEIKRIDTDYFSDI